ncbi:MAG: response regulator, partial [Planctomycetales bacterium]
LLGVLKRFQCLPPSPVLIIDDDEPTRKMLRRMLESEGWNVSHAEDGQIALRRLERELPHMILLDLMMPNMDGFEFLRRFQANDNWKDIPVIVLTAKELTDQDREQLTGSVRNILQKSPQECDRLMGELRKIVAQRVRPKPAVPAKKSTPAAPRKPAPSPVAETNEASLNILLAEDNAFNQRLALRLLKKMGHSIEVAENGRKAVELWEAGSFDVILMDVQMPEMDGFEATVAIREKEERLGSRIPIIAMTAHAMVGDRERCLDAGMDDYLPKPVQTEELIATLARQTAPPSDAQEETEPKESSSGEDRELFSMERLKDLAGGDDEFLRELIGDFFNDTDSN